MNYTRAPFFFSTWLDKGGSSQVRVRRPMEILRRHGLVQSRFEDMAWPPEMVELLKPDVFIWARMTEDAHITYMTECREACPEAYFIYEIDDALDVVPEKSVHRPHMRIDIADRMVECAKMCDVVVVSTDDLAKHMRGLVGDMEIRVAPNMMADEDFAKAADIRQQMLRCTSKPRIGWGGGISHKGDLDLLIPVIEHFGNRVEWVFLGMKPNVDIPVEFHEGVSPDDYLAKLASLGLDLMVAPLEDNLFNQCKSNLRLLEGGVCSYPVIASPVSPYTTKRPPVFGYARTTPEWIQGIEKFLGLTAHQQQKHGKMMHDWVQKHYNLDTNAEKRVAAWLPQGATFFKPQMRSADSKKVSVVGMLLTQGDATFVAAKSLKEALEGNNDVLWLRSFTMLVLPQMHLMKQLLDETQAATVSAMTNGTGETGFPNRESLFNCSPENSDAIDDLLKTIATKDIDLGFPNGPAILLSRRALNVLGLPQLSEFTNGQDPTQVHEEAALYEWGISAHANGFCNKLANVYAIASQNCAPFDVTRLSHYVQSRYGIDLTIPDVCKPIRQALELAYHKKLYVATPVSIGNYQEWADVWDTLTQNDLEFFATQSLNSQFYVVVQQNGTSNIQDKDFRHYQTIPAALAAAKAAKIDNQQQWLVVVKDGVLREHALWMLDRAVTPETVAIYADHDYLGVDDNKIIRRDPDFKPLPFDHDMLLARDYVSPISALNIAELDERFLEDDVTGVYGAFLNLVQRFGKDRIIHLPAILFHQLTKTVDVVKREVRRKCAVATKHAEAMKWSLVVNVHSAVPAYGRVDYKPLRQPLVSIIIPTKNKLEMLQPCIDSLFAFTDYDNFEIIIVDNGSTNPKHIAYRQSLVGHPKIKLLEWDHPFNFSTINNFAAKVAEGEYLLLLNDDTRCLPESRDWLHQMVGCAEREHVGTVGAKLLHPWGSIQHIGVSNEFAMCGHLHHSLPSDHIGYQGICLVPHEVTANTAACVLIKKSLYDEIGGLDEKLPNNFGDIALCHDIWGKGLVNICVMDAILQHFETVTRKKENRDVMTKEGMILRSHWNKPDPLWNRNLSITGQPGVGGMNFNVPAWPGLPRPWRKLLARTQRTILLVGDYNDVQMRRLLAMGDRVFQTAIVGFQLYVIHPLLQNIDPIDLRQPREAVMVLNGLGIDTVVVRSLRGGPLETLGFVQALPYPVHYVPLNDEFLTPIPGNVAVTQKDIDEQGTAWGQINIVAWREYWRDFCNVATVDLSDVPEIVGVMQRKCEEIR